MRLVTWNLGQRLNGGHAPNDAITALAALEPDIVILAERLPGPARRRACWDWLARAAGTLKHRRAILVGDFAIDANDERTDDIDHLRRLTDAGWKHAVPSDSAGYPATNGDAGRLDHAFLSPSLQQIDARYALAAAGFRFTGTSQSLSDQPVLIVDLQ